MGGKAEGMGARKGESERGKDGESVRRGDREDAWGEGARGDGID